MIDSELIKKHFYLSNYLVLCEMFLNEYKNPTNLTIEDIKKYNPGHLGSSLNINFILSNLNYFLNNKGLKSQIVIGTGHAGASLISDSYINGSMHNSYLKYDRNILGLNELINDFGKTIRTEINPEYPNTIYDGGELGYSLPTAYGYAINSDADIVPCIIGDGECETGSISSSWYLNKILKTKSKVLPIINLNGLKMGSSSYLSKLSIDELDNYFGSLGYTLEVVEANESLEDTIKRMQLSLEKLLSVDSPMLIFKSKKGYTIPAYKEFEVEGKIISHKNPLLSLEKEKKYNIVKFYLEKYYDEFFDKNGQLLDVYFKKFEVINPNNSKELTKIKSLKEEKSSNIKYATNFLIEFLEKNNGMIFSPDELHSNQLGILEPYTFEMLNENVLQALLFGYVQANNPGYFIGYEGFMPIINSMIEQVYKYYSEKLQLKFLDKKNSLNYILTSTAFENTYSHQNPDFVNSLLVRDDKCYNILYPKDGISLIKCLEYTAYQKDMINLIISSKRASKQYESVAVINGFDIIKDEKNPDITICATGDYMLSLANEICEDLEKYKVKIIYVTNPKILDVNSRIGISNEEFNSTFNGKIIYLYSGNGKIIESLLYERNKDITVYGYSDKVAVMGGFENTLRYNNMTREELTKKSKLLIKK